MASNEISREEPFKWHSSLYIQRISDTHKVITWLMGHFAARLLPVVLSCAVLNGGNSNKDKRQPKKKTAQLKEISLQATLAFCSPTLTLLDKKLEWKGTRLHGRSHREPLIRVIWLWKSGRAGSGVSHGGGSSAICPHPLFLSLWADVVQSPSPSAPWGGHERGSSMAKTSTQGMFV